MLFVAMAPIRAAHVVVAALAVAAAVTVAGVVPAAALDSNLAAEAVAGIAGEAASTIGTGTAAAVRSIGPVATAGDPAAGEAAIAAAVDEPAEEKSPVDWEEKPTLNTLIHTRGHGSYRPWKPRPTPPKCIIKVWEVLKAPAHPGRHGSPAQLLLIRVVVTAHRLRGGRLGRRATATKAWACVKRWAKRSTGAAGGRRSGRRLRFVCAFVGAPSRVCGSYAARRRYAALCGGRLRRVGRVWPLVRVRPEAGPRCGGHPEPSPEAH